MTVGELKALLAGVPDSAEIQAESSCGLYTSDIFDGYCAVLHPTHPNWYGPAKVGDKSAAKFVVLTTELKAL